LATFARRLPAFVLALLLAGLLQGLGFVVMVAPWFLAAAATVFVPEVARLEAAGWRSIRRAMRVARGRTGVRMGLVLVLLLALCGLVVLAGGARRPTLGVLLDVRLHVEGLWTDGGSLYALLGFWLSVPLCAVVRYLAYVDLRTRKEGWDLQRRF